MNRRLDKETMMQSPPETLLSVNKNELLTCATARTALKNIRLSKKMPDKKTRVLYDSVQMKNRPNEPLETDTRTLAAMG